MTSASRLVLDALEDRITPAAHLAIAGTDLFPLVITNPNVVDVFVGSAWATDPTLKAQRQKLDQFVSTLSSGAFMDTLSEYYEPGIIGGDSNQHIGRGSLIGTVQLSWASGYVFRESDLQNYLANQIFQSHVPYPRTLNYMLMVYLAPG